MLVGFISLCESCAHSSESTWPGSHAKPWDPVGRIHSLIQTHHRDVRWLPKENKVVATAKEGGVVGRAGNRMSVNSCLLLPYPLLTKDFLLIASAFFCSAPCLILLTSQSGL